MGDRKWLEFSDVEKPGRKVLVDASDIVCVSASPDAGTEVWARSGVPLLVAESVDDIKAAMGIFPVKVSRGK